jgi:hypothetical protein
VFIGVMAESYGWAWLSLASRSVPFCAAVLGGTAPLASTLPVWSFKKIGMGPQADSCYTGSG